jgi:OOP family OmpA-OmpF porin
MRKLTWSCVVAAFLAGGSPLSHAQDKNALQDAYVGLGGGASRLRFKPDDFTSSVAGVQESKDESDNKGYRLIFGYRMNRNWALELGYTNFGKFSHHYDDGAGGVVHQDYKASAWSLGLLPILPLGNHFSLFGKIGIVKSSVTTESATSTGTLGDTLATAGLPVGSASKSRKSTVLGAGAQIDFTSAGIRLEYEDYGEVGDQDNTGRARARMLSLSLMYRF